MQRLNLPTYSFKLKSEDGRNLIYDDIRRRYVALTPEEWVRQNFIRYLVHEGKYPPGLIAVEVMSPFNNLRKRVDILIHNRQGKPVMIVECKSPEIKLDDAVFDQIVCYNMGFKVPYIIVTNGMDHYACRIDHLTNKYEFLLVIPLYEDLL